MKLKTMLAGGIVALAAASFGANAYVGTPVKIMTYNINHNHDATVAAEIAALDADIVCLQEVDTYLSDEELNESFPLADLVELLDGYSYDDSLLQNDSWADGTMTILYKASTAPKTDSGKTTGPQTFTIGEGDDEVLDGLTAFIYEFDNFYVATTRICTNGVDSVAALKSALAEYDDKPVIFAGDLDAAASSDTLTAFTNDFMTVQSPVSGTDYIAIDTAHADKVVFRSAAVASAATGSDHKPLVCEIAVLPEDTEVEYDVDESQWTTGVTGTWKDENNAAFTPKYNATTGKAALSEENTFTPAMPSTGIATPTLEIKTTFSALKRELDDPSDEAQAALRIDSNNVFQVWTVDGPNKYWLNVAATGITPDEDEENDYTVRFAFDYNNGTYSVKVKGDSGDFASLAATEGGVTAFALANSTATQVSSVIFRGDTHFTSMLGWTFEAIGFDGYEDGEAVTIGDAQVVLDAAKAEWLNALGSRAEVDARLAQLTATEFQDSYLCNLDIMNADASKTFTITSIEVKDDKVTIGVTLTRTGAVQANDKDAPINGVLNFYGSSVLADFKAGNTEKIETGVTFSNNDFAESDTATATIDLGTDTPTFFNAKIEEAQAEEE